jgi:glycosyltransferase involved in cell wall biosynthesis
VIGIVAANKGHPSRKGFSQALQAVARMMEAHEDVYLHIHTVFDPVFSQGENLVAMIRQLGLPMKRIRIADQYAMIFNPLPARAMAQVYNAFDVLLNPAWGEGFGIPVMEAQACGVPAVVTDFSAMREVCGAGWHVKGRPYWSALEAWQVIPDVDEIVAALEECRSLKPTPRFKLAQRARRHAMNYNVKRVFQLHLLPALTEAERRFSMRRPVRIPSRLKVAA